MNYILSLVCSVVLMRNFAFARLDLNDDAVVGVTQKNLEEYMKNAINGFSKIILKGDEQLDYPVMEPYKAGPFSWEYVDTSDSKKYKLNLFSKGETIIKGLSNYRLGRMVVSAQDMRVSFNIRFLNLETQFPYKLDGYLYKNLMPIYGEGLIKLLGDYENFHVLVDLGIEKGNVVVQLVRIFRYHNEAKIKVTGLMDLPEKFANYIIDDILSPLVDQYASDMLSQFARGVIEEAISGMTPDELFDLLDHFVKKNNEDEN